MQVPMRKAICLLLLAAACACTHAPQLVPAPHVQPQLSVPTVRERMIQLARDEWLLFGQTRWQTIDGQPALARPPGPVLDESSRLSRVLMYWYAVTDKPIFGHQGELRPWSAAFLGWLARSAGMDASAWPSSVLHWDAIDAALRGTQRFAAADARQVAVQPGDVACAPRSTPEQPGFAQQASFAAMPRGPYHCEIVVAVRAGQADLIGGNVQDTVALSTAALDARGCLVATPARPWVVVLAQRDAPWP